ncbi:DUF2510 domain-containing protein [Nakamurella sp. PAMC28650]|jgi:hypothetical protein|uniref:DUF2510 domain-containing protein n=1 Tax=Nakamurella sp. PAMC28650 TaxID=2762325 RepID=UPI00164DCFF7|nr:DUF2510 domain-containing protein [Nakamurella sp. PAMC28650]QNK81420.1 DUF2510 domain-containing protein [Nakamurella sp. PAMC28650]
MTAPTAGWYSDPNGAPTLRYWNGTAWTDATQQAPSPAVQSPYGQAGPYGQTGTYPGAFPAGPNPSYAYPPAPTPPPGGGAAAGLWAQNKTSFITVAICIVYLVIAGFSHLVFFGILPVLYTVRSFQAKESLAWLAAAVTVVTIGFSIWRTTH